MTDVNDPTLGLESTETYLSAITTLDRSEVNEERRKDKRN
jgi:hypothetical protein